MTVSFTMYAIIIVVHKINFKYIRRGLVQKLSFTIVTLITIDINKHLSEH